MAWNIEAWMHRIGGVAPVPAHRRIRARRLQLDLTLEEVCERLHRDWPGINPSALSKIERGKRVLSVDRLLAFAEALRCDPLDLLDPLPPRR